MRLFKKGKFLNKRPEDLFITTSLYYLRKKGRKKKEEKETTSQYVAYTMSHIKLNDKIKVNCGPKPDGVK